MQIDSKYFKHYRTQLGFSNQSLTKVFFSGKDISYSVDYEFIDKLNIRLKEIVRKFNQLVSFY